MHFSRLNIITILLLFVNTLCFYTIGCSQLQPQYSSHQNRPYINLSRVPTSAYEANKLYLKFAPRLANQLATHQPKNINGFISYGFPVVDTLNKQFGLYNSSLLFGNILKDVELAAEHIYYGFNLWMEVSFSSNQPITTIINAYINTGFFEVVEPIYKAVTIGNNAFTTNDNLFNNQWHLKNTGQAGGTIGKDISITDAWNIEVGKPNVIVSVHDNPININHVDIANNIAINKSFNFTNNTNTLSAGSNHGNFCAGIIGAVNNNNIGISSVAGGDGNINSGIRLISCQVFSADGNRGFAESFVYAADNGAAISSNSWGYATEDVYNMAVLDAIDYFCDKAGGSVLKGGVVVFASGNNGQLYKMYPAAYDRVICVAATNNKDAKANYSNYGSWVDISAPGGEGAAGAANGIFGLGSNNDYGFGGGGTSYACPQVAGVAALVVSVLNGKASANDVKEIILSTTDNNYPENANYIGLLGNGRLNAYKAVLKAKSFLSKTVNSITNFSAKYNCNSFNLNWIKNSSNNNVIVAYNTNSNFGTLTDGSSYSLGSILQGGGNIVYSGNANSFSFPIMVDSALQHNFKIWSVDNNNNYSFSQTIDNYTTPTVTSSGKNVLIQNFDYPPLLPTKTWNFSSKRDLTTWIHTARDTANTGVNDDYSLCMYSYSYNTILGSADTLLCPQITTKNADSIALTFWRSYQFSNRNLPYSDTLEVLVSIDCGNSFTSIFKKGGVDLATISDQSITEFYPFGIDKWKKEIINLSSFKSANKLLIAFRGYNGKGNNQFIDNISVDVLYKNDIALTVIKEANNTNCNNQFSPTITLKNNGLQTIRQLNITCQIDNGNLVNTNINSSLQSNVDTTIKLNTQNVTVGNHVLKVFNTNADSFANNDTLTTNFTILNNAVLPLVEGFEGTIFPPPNWQVNNEVNSLFTWRKNQLVGSASNNAAFAQNFLNKTITTNHLLTPNYLVASNTDSVFLLFDVAAANATLIDTLEVSYSKNCGATFTTIYKKWGNNLQTINQTQALTTEFFPAQNQWRRDSINLSNSILNNETIMLRFSNYNNNGNNIFIDNIKLYSISLPQKLKQQGYIIYPNPMVDYITIQHYQTTTNLKSIIVYNAVGKRVLVKNYSDTIPVNITLLTQFLVQGLYTIQLNYTDKTVVEKVIKLK